MSATVIELAAGPLRLALRPDLGASIAGLWREGLPVLRATVNGISAVVDAQGRVRAHVPGGVAGRIDMALPPALPPTLFARIGNLLPLGTAIVLLAFAALALRRTRG